MNEYEFVWTVWICHLMIVFIMYYYIFRLYVIKFFKVLQIFVWFLEKNVRIYMKMYEYLHVDSGFRINIFWKEWTFISFHMFINIFLHVCLCFSYDCMIFIDDLCDIFDWTLSCICHVILCVIHCFMYFFRVFRTFVCFLKNCIEIFILFHVFY